jgi:hypothetical protein
MNEACLSRIGLTLDVLMPSSRVQEALHGHGGYIRIGQDAVTSRWSVGILVHPRLQHHPPVRPHRAESSSQLDRGGAYHQRRFTSML